MVPKYLIIILVVKIEVLEEHVSFHADVEHILVIWVLFHFPEENFSAHSFSSCLCHHLG